MVKKYLAAFTAVIALSTAAFGAMAQQGVSNAKIDADVKKATGTLDDIQKLGKKIEARHNQDVASARRSTVRQAANRAVNTTRRAANTARKAANAAKNTAGKKAAGKNAAGKKKTSK